MRQRSWAGALLVLLSSAALAEPGWRTYANDRFGTTVDYPDLFSRRDRPPDNSDGQGFRTADGRAELKVYGFFNVETKSPAELMAADRQPGTTYSYAAATGRGFAQSGVRGDWILYSRCAMSDRSDDIVGCVTLEYPRADASRWDAVVTRISRSLRFGAPW